LKISKLATWIRLWPSSTGIIYPSISFMELVEGRLETDKFGDSKSPGNCPSNPLNPNRKKYKSGCNHQTLDVYPNCSGYSNHYTVIPL
jgi:hypothetical protein